MGRLVEPVPTMESEDRGCPPGGVLAWTIGPDGKASDPISFVSVVAAIQAIPELILSRNADEVVINHKYSDGSFLDVWVCRREYHLPKQKPFDWSKLFFWRRK